MRLLQFDIIHEKTVRRCLLPFFPTLLDLLDPVEQGQTEEVTLLTYVLHFSEHERRALREHLPIPRHGDANEQVVKPIVSSVHDTDDSFQLFFIPEQRKSSHPHAVRSNDFSVANPTTILLDGDTGVGKSAIMMEAAAQNSHK